MIQPPDQLLRCISAHNMTSFLKWWLHSSRELVVIHSLLYGEKCLIFPCFFFFFHFSYKQWFDFENNGLNLMSHGLVMLMLCLVCPFFSFIFSLTPTYQENITALVISFSSSFSSSFQHILKEQYVQVKKWHVEGRKGRNQVDIEYEKIEKKILLLLSITDHVVMLFEFSLQACLQSFQADMSGFWIMFFIFFYFTGLPLGWSLLSPLCLFWSFAVIVWHHSQQILKGFEMKYLKFIVFGEVTQSCQTCRKLHVHKLLGFVNRVYTDRNGKYFKTKTKM